MISSSNLETPCIDLPSIDEDTGHMLVHYLYTGTYQTLDNTDAFVLDERAIEFKRAVSAYFTGRTFQLHGLQRLAIETIENIGITMSTLDIFSAIDKEFPIFPDKTCWFYNYLKKRARATCEDDPTLFAKDAFLGPISNVDLIKILVQSVAELYSAMVSREPSANDQ
jgi:hypothetical protein